MFPAARSYGRLLVPVLASGLFFLLPAASRAMLNVKVGQVPPPFTLPDPSGARVSSADLAGSPAAILFWSTWSPRSAELLEDFKAYHTQYSPQGLRIVAVNVDGENLDSGRRAMIRDYASRMALPFPVLLDENLAVFAAFGVVAHPSTVVLDRGGEISYILVGYPSSLREELKENLQKALGIYKEPPSERVSSVGSVPAGHALQFYNLGLQLAGRGMTDKALDHFRQASEKDPTFIEPAIWSARLQLAAGDLDAAGAILGRMNPEAVNRSDLRYLHGRLLLLQGKAAGAEAAFAALRDEFPREGWGYWGLGLAALSKGETGAALDLMEQAKALQPDNLEAEGGLKAFLKQRWLRGEAPPDEARLVALFPSLTELKERYARLSAPLYK